jgi:hypothetical protein
MNLEMDERLRKRQVQTEALGRGVERKRRGKVKLLCAEMCEIYHGNLLYRMTLHDASLLSRDPTHLRH